MSGKICGIRCEYFENPVGIGTNRPRFSYRIESAERGVMQEAYRIGAASTHEDAAAGRFDLWDSGERQGTRTAQIVWEGARLASRQRVYYRIFSHLSTGELLESDTAFFEIGLMKRRDYCARFIQYQPENQPHGRRGSFGEGLPAPMLRRAFSLPARPVRARLYCTALGLYEVKLNGRAVTENRLCPGWTNYDRVLQVQAYDVTKWLNGGENCVSAVLGDGWYAGCIGLAGREFYNGYPLAFYCQLEMTLENGETFRLLSDKSWKYAFGPLRADDLILGEHYDATMELPGWELASFDDSGWADAIEYNYSTSPLHGDFVCQQNPPIRVKEERIPQEVRAIGPDTYILDMGQNITGWARLTVRGAARGQKITLRFGEMCKDDGTLYTGNLRFAKATDTYLCRGDTEEIWEPRFTFHGFRYAEISGLGYCPKPEDLIGLAAYSDMEITGDFVCGNEKVNKLFQNILWGQKGNFLDVPTDCPQRDERLGWTGDANVFCRTACYNMDAASFYGKWLLDLNTSQRLDGSYPDVAPYVNLTATAIKHTKNADGGNPVWAEAGLVVPYVLYQFYQDTRILEQHYSGMLRYMEFLEQDSENYLRGDFGYGDWLNVDEVTPNPVIGTAFYAYGAALMEKISAVLGKEAERMRFQRLHEEIARAFRKEFVNDSSGRIFGDTQTCYLLALQFGLVEGEGARRAAQRLREKIREAGGHLSCGFVGVSFLLPVLTGQGDTVLAYDLLLEESYPSWLYSVNNGATTVWERWNSYTAAEGFGDVGMNSFNHYSLGSVAQWFYESVGGIQPDEVSGGFQNLTLRPAPDRRLGFAEVRYQSLYGEITSEWRYSDRTLCYRFTVPANCRAEILLRGNGTVLRAEGAEQVAASGRELRFLMGSGTCEIEILEA